MMKNSDGRQMQELSQAQIEEYLHACPIVSAGLARLGAVCLFCGASAQFCQGIEAAEEFACRGDNAGAASLLDRLISMMPWSGYALHLRITVAYDLDDVAAMLRALRSLFDCAERAADAFWMRALLLERIGAYEGAESDLMAALRTHPRDGCLVSDLNRVRDVLDEIGREGEP